MRAAVLAVIASVGAGAMDLTLDSRAVQDALWIANHSLEAEHRRFHADYRFQVNAAPVDFIGIVTPFRRLVLAGETAARTGGRMFGQREALAALQPDPARVEVFVELTFHPLNTFIGVPEYEVELQPAAARGVSIAPERIDRLPRYGPRLETGWYPFPYPYTARPGAPSGSGPLAGGTLIARFDGNALDAKSLYQVVVKDGKTELSRTRVDLGRLR
jgi:hypothetical protein